MRLSAQNRAILVTTSARLGVGVDDLLGDDRSVRYKVPRYIAWRLLRDRGMTLIPIAQMFNRQHSTVLNGLNWLERKLKESGVIRDAYEALRKDLEAQGAIIEARKALDGAYRRAGDTRKKGLRIGMTVERLAKYDDAENDGSGSYTVSESPVRQADGNWYVALEELSDLVPCALIRRVGGAA